MFNRLATATAVMATVTCVGVLAQKPDAEIGKIADQYQTAFNNGDVKALANLYTAEALRITPDGRFLTGRPAIEKSYVEAFSGPFKGAKLTLNRGTTRTLTADVALIEGTFDVAGAAGPVIRGRYLNTVIREGGVWRLASVTTVPQAAAPAQ